MLSHNHILSCQCHTTYVTQPSTESTSITQETGPCHLPLIREQLHASGLSQAASDIIMCALRDGTELAIVELIQHDQPFQQYWSLVTLLPLVHTH